jgi:hypothetical protein
MLAGNLDFTDGPLGSIDIFNLKAGRWGGPRFVDKIHFWVIIYPTFPTEIRWGFMSSKDSEDEGPSNMEEAEEEHLHWFYARYS